jgi:carboxyl-terminal processing protease
MSQSNRNFSYTHPNHPQNNQRMNWKNSIVLCSFVGIIGTAWFFNNHIVSFFSPDDPNPKKEAEMMRTVLDGIARMHFQPKEVDDKFSGQVFDYYLKESDGGKRFFTQQDIDAFKVYREQLDDQAKAGTFEFFNMTLARLDESLMKTQEWYREILASPMNFTVNSTVNMDGDKVKWAKDEAALRERWENMLKYEVLSRAIDEEAKQQKPDFRGEKKSFAQLEKEAREKVLDVYEKWYKRMLKMDRDRRLEMYLNAFTNVVDPHTGYYSPKDKENFDIQMSGKLEGIGARLQSDGEKTTVFEIVPGGPAWKQGDLQNKDIILKVGQGDDEPIDIMGWDIDDVVQKVRGAKGTIVKLTIQKPDGAVKEIAITRDLVIMEEGFAKSLIINDEAQKDKLGYIYLPKFYADFTPQGATSCYEDVAREIEKLKAENVKGIILDLRNNGGGSLRDVVKMSGLFIEQGPIVQVKSRSRKPEVMSDTDTRIQWAGPLVVMVNGGSASASEILAAAMQDYDRAVVVGSAVTYGKGTVQRFLDLDQMARGEDVRPLGEMKITVQKFYRVTGKTTQLDGVTPDIVLPDFYNLVENGEGENDYPLESTTIEAVPYNQSAYRIPDLNTLRTNSEKRVSADPTFRKINENAMRMRKMQDETTYVLQLEKYRQWNKRQDEESAQYEDMFQPVPAFQLSNLNADMAHIQSDTSRVARNDSWIKDRKKDIQLYETMQIMYDMIRMDKLAGKN